MNWVLALIGAFLGAALSGERGMFGAVVGALAMWLLAALPALNRRVAALEQEVQALRARAPAASGVPRPETVAAPSAAQAPAGAMPVQATAVAPDPRPPVLPEQAGDSGGLGAAAAQEVASPEPASEPLSEEEQEEVARLRAVLKSQLGGMSGTDDALDPAAEEVASAASASSAATPSPAAQRPIPQRAGTGPSARTAAPTEPGWDQRLVLALKRWFTEGNVPVKIGVLVLFVGVAALLRYAAVQGYFTFPIPLRIATVAFLAVVALGLGWRERLRKPAFGLSLQGGAIGVLLLTVFASFNFYHLLPAGLAFSLIVVLVAGAALLSVLQRNMPLAALGFLGGYLAPVLINTGSNNYIGLFSYYAVLNAAVFGISWARSWRLINLIGFVFTFGVGSAWGYRAYRPEFFSTVEPFLVLFFVFYVVIGLLYVIRQTEHRRPWVDGTLVFGTPLVAFPLQAAMLKHDKLALAFSALVVAVVYAGLVYYLRRRRDERLLTEAYAALALGFATLAIPLAFSAGTTATLWALEGAGVAWLGIRQGRWFPWLAGLALQFLAAGAYLIGVLNLSHYALTSAPLLLNPVWLGASILAFSGYALSLIHDRHKPVPALPALLFAWATFWWLVATLSQVDRAGDSLGEWQYLMLALVATLAIATVLRGLLSWPRLNWLLGLGAISGLALVFYANTEFGAPLAMTTVPLWLTYAAALLWALWAGRGMSSRSLSLAHLLGLWTLALAAAMQLEHFSRQQQLAEGWQFAGIVAPLALMTWGLWRRPQFWAWPRTEAFAGYDGGWFALAWPLLGLAWITGLFAEGSAAPLPYVPVLNPTELTLLAIIGLFIAYGDQRQGLLGNVRRLLPYLGFALLTMTTLRTVHHWHGEAWSMRILDSGFSQSALTVVWSLLGVSAWVLGSQRGNRRLWMGGALLMGIVLLKLIAVDRQYMGNIPGIVSFIAVGLLLVGVGYFAPSPPRTEEAA